MTQFSPSKETVRAEHQARPSWCVAGRFSVQMLLLPEPQISQAKTVGSFRSKLTKEGSLFSVSGIYGKGVWSGSWTSPRDILLGVASLQFLVPSCGTI